MPRPVSPRIQSPWDKCTCAHLNTFTHTYTHTHTQTHAHTHTPRARTRKRTRTRTRTRTMRSFHTRSLLLRKQIHSSTWQWITKTHTSVHNFCQHYVLTNTPKEWNIRRLMYVLERSITDVEAKDKSRQNQSSDSNGRHTPERHSGDVEMLQSCCRTVCRQVIICNSRTKTVT